MFDEKRKIKKRRNLSNKHYDSKPKTVERNVVIGLHFVSRCELCVVELDYVNKQIAVKFLPCCHNASERT